MLTLLEIPLVGPAPAVRRGAGQQHPAQDGGERRRLDRRAAPCRDMLGDCFGLLGSDTALLDREVESRRRPRTRRSGRAPRRAVRSASS